MRVEGLIVVAPSGQVFLTDKGLDMLTRQFTAAQLIAIGEIAIMSAPV